MFCSVCAHPILPHEQVTLITGTYKVRIFPDLPMTMEAHGDCKRRFDELKKRKYVPTKQLPTGLALEFGLNPAYEEPESKLVKVSL